jgi:uncharacterized membrane protein YqjE
MNEAQHESQGPVKRIVGSITELLRTRIELIGIELAEEKEHMLAVLFFGLSAMLLVMMALVTLTLLVAAAFWDTYRWQALAVLTLIYVLVAIGLGLKARGELQRSQPVLGATLTEFDKDRELFRQHR